jgi:hypothetical protein
MDLTTWVDVAIGLTLIYLGTGLFVTIVNEYIAQMLNWRGRQLHAALKQLIDDQKIKQMLMQHPALVSFFNDQPGKANSYVDPKILAQLLVGSLSTATATNNTIEQISEAIDKLPHSTLKTQLQSIIRTTGNKTENLVVAVSDWMDRSLTMMGESYKRNLQIMSFVVGLAIAVMLNINTVTLTERLYHDKELRNATTARAILISENITQEKLKECQAQSDKISKSSDCAELEKLIEVIQKRDKSLSELPIGWSNTALSDFSTLSGWAGLESLVGWLLTALAVSLGAPFWFDLLNKAVSVRHGMKKPE